MNKRLLVLTGLFLCAFTLCAQSDDVYRPFIEEGKVWHYEGFNPNSAPEYRQKWKKSYWVEGDTAIAAYQGTKLYATSNGTIEKIERCYCGALIEDGAKVFIIPVGSDKPRLLYDFSCQKGDEIIIGASTLMIQERFSISYNGASRVVLNWSPEEFDLFQDSWIEGIGAPCGFLEYMYAWNSGSYSYELLSCEVNGKVIFDYQKFRKDLITAYKTSSFPIAIHGKIFDLLGHPLASPPAKGAYIEGGGVKIRK